MDLNKLIDLSYLFYRFPPAGFSWPIRIALLALFVGSIVLAIYTQTKIKKNPLNKKLWQKIQVWAWTNGLVGLILVGLREVRAIYLSARGWLLIFIILMLVWLIFIIIFAKNKIQSKEEIMKKKEEFDKWLPTPHGGTHGKRK